MIKKFLFILCISLSLPLKVCASTNLDDYDTTNLKETLDVAGIEFKKTNYEETDNQVSVYLFWSTTLIGVYFNINYKDIPKVNTINFT